jgi:fucose 4-O-acetylase-like acetyltransferase
LQYLQSLQAWQGSEPVQVDEWAARGSKAAPRTRIQRNLSADFLESFIFSMLAPPISKMNFRLLLKTLASAVSLFMSTKHGFACIFDSIAQFPRGVAVNYVAVVIEYRDFIAVR